MTKIVRKVHNMTLVGFYQDVYYLSCVTTKRKKKYVLP